MKNVWNGAISLAMLDNQKCVACKFCFTEQSETNSLEPYIFFFKITYLSKNFFFFTQTPILAPIIPNFYVFIRSRQRPGAAGLGPVDPKSNLIGWVKVRVKVIFSSWDIWRRHLWRFLKSDAKQNASKSV